MNLVQMLADLRAERRNLDEAIAVLARIGYGREKRPGRPPLWMKGVPGAKKRGRPPGSKNKPKQDID